MVCAIIGDRVRPGDEMRGERAGRIVQMALKAGGSAEDLSEIGPQK